MVRDLSETDSEFCSRPDSFWHFRRQRRNVKNRGCDLHMALNVQHASVYDIKVEDWHFEEQFKNGWSYDGVVAILQGIQ